MRRGFTLVEMLVVIVVVGILVAFAMLKYENARQAAYLAVMKSDLKNLAIAEEAFFNDSAYYTISLSAMANLTPSAGVTLSVNEATPMGWSATAASVNTYQRCYLFSGSAAPVGSATIEGAISCS
jgi:prepilin-type N-terminal cleavage/methylation domain-containing protein